MIPGQMQAYPVIVCLCGSTRFYAQFQDANYELTMRGEIVLSVGFYPHAVSEHGHGEGVGHDSAEKVALDELHKRKIDLADYVYVINPGGYIGESTRSEIAYAVAHGKPVRYLEEQPGAGEQVTVQSAGKPRPMMLEELRKHGADGMTLQEACDAFPAWDREDILHHLRFLLLLGRVARGIREGIETVTWRVSEDQAQKPPSVRDQLIAILRGAGDHGITWQEAREQMPEMYRETTSSILHRLRDEEVAEGVETDGEVRRWRLVAQEAEGVQGEPV